MLTLAACAVGPDYHRPQLPVPDAIRGATAAPGTESVADTNWWDLYKDADLQNLLTAALLNNSDINAAIARIDEARATLGQSTLGLLPTIDANGDVVRSKSSVDALLPGQRRIGNVEAASVNVSYELDFWGRLRRVHESARATLLSSQFAKRAVAVTLVANVADAYFSLLALDSQLEITRRTVTSRAKP